MLARPARAPPGTSRARRRLRTGARQVDRSPLGAPRGRRQVDRSCLGLRGRRWQVDRSCLGLRGRRRQVDRSCLGLRGRRRQVDRSRLGLRGRRRQVDRSRLAVRGRRRRVDRSPLGAPRRRRHVDPSERSTRRGHLASSSAPLGRPRRDRSTCRRSLGAPRRRLGASGHPRRASRERPLSTLTRLYNRLRRPPSGAYRERRRRGALVGSRRDPRGPVSRLGEPTHRSFSPCPPWSTLCGVRDGLLDFSGNRGSSTDPPCLPPGRREASARASGRRGRPPSLPAR